MITSNRESLSPCPRKTAGLFYQGECKTKDNITDLLDDEGTLALTIRSESFLPGQQPKGYLNEVAFRCKFGVTSATPVSTNNSVSCLHGDS